MARVSEITPINQATVLKLRFLVNTSNEIYNSGFA